MKVIIELDGHEAKQYLEDVGAIFDVLSELAVRLDHIERKIGKTMADQTTLSEQLTAAANAIQEKELAIEHTLTSLANDQAKAFLDLRAWIEKNAASQIDPKEVARLQDIATRLGTVSDTLTALDDAAKGADPGGVGGGTPATGTISGTVTDAATGAPVVGANVVSGDVSTTTDDNGQYTLSLLPVGDATVVTAAAVGYQAMTLNAVVAEGGTTTLDIQLTVI